MLLTPVQIAEPLPMTMPTPRDARELRALESVYRLFRDAGRWPVFRDVDRVLNRRGEREADTVLQAMTPGLLYGVHAGSPLMNDQVVGLTLAGLAACPDAEEDLRVLLAVVRHAAGLVDALLPGEPEVVLTSADVRRFVRLPAAGRDAILARVYRLIGVEAFGWTSLGTNEEDDSWSFTADRHIRKFAGVESVEACWDLLHPPLWEGLVTHTPPNDVLELMFGTPGSVQRMSGSTDPTTGAGRTVFVVHGRNGAARDAMFTFLRALGLKPLEWSQAVALTGHGSPYIGEVLDAAFAAAQAVVVLMTPDEVAYLRSDYAEGPDDRECNAAPQARPNVLFEAGMAMGRDAQRTVLVELGTLRPFSDVAGRHAVRLDDSAAARKALAQRLETAGCDIDTTGADWLTAGGFTTPPPPGGGLPLGKRVPAGGPPSRIQVDLRHHDRSGGTGRLEVVNLGSESIFDLDLELPPEAGSFHLMSSELPLDELPPGKSFVLLTSQSIAGGKKHFKVHVTGRTSDGETYDEHIFLSLVG